MIFMFGFFDRVLDIIGLGTLIYWSVIGTKWYYTRRGKKRAAHDV